LENDYKRIQICPWGMKDFVKKILAEERVTNIKALPVDVVAGLGLKENEFDSNDIRVTCNDVGNKGYENFRYLYCDRCVEEKLPSS